MSRIGKRAIPIPAGTEVSVADSNVTVKAKGGTLQRSIHPDVAISVANGEVSVSPARETRLARALWGTYAAHVRNMIAGVNQPFVKKLQIEGIGFRADIAGTQLKLMVGYSHPVLIAVPEGLAVAVEKNVISISGADKEAVGQFAASVRSARKPEPYKGKGIRYEDEVVRRKQGKKAATAAAA
ncbi:50S ribosomal protein L6 [Candidatus Kaiserbacteria bacterium RIFCSPHIGHO2_02_FULL_59_21]|uniref:Large ribosomal subunit protein uL6 n=2 Tax=Candidatus Kaiseribacteriota TaxID=1752734 RepID=A0A0G2B1G3_9BACT|nr:MAG: 50S ribosomal protein L6 [Candidatus Kaiserbacteria bacterium GW2011_GWA2_58_9]OGG63321.1 MAG: 50S ribosomal protein L6 [Candidatus Kaiserbacteria bacterium RIFCSPHIGHO2_01_FULL_58_22]OGG66640.1 MAG: 50S ribosomal protein L6 [Candidatus Kaiserbacteria bacterium RIFCSPHIGHO2_02_FULL_59_21]OGG78985.1 MAG: 50S ribosomal protein L6 [Candidatus Kaiserbacteria bacterium RIFCSPLOWO2_01_FULL_59_34]OGG84391.1 MAG: 50S ribosomal protein L6 [Candidatus Kaiserbacteria bacterium RIFCSPLOWO2_02_FULL_